MDGIPTWKAEQGGGTQLFHNCWGVGSPRYPGVPYSTLGGTPGASRPGYPRRLEVHTHIVWVYMPFAGRTCTRLVCKSQEQASLEATRPWGHPLQTPPPPPVPPSLCGGLGYLEGTGVAPEALAADALNPLLCAAGKAGCRRLRERLTALFGAAGSALQVPPISVVGWSLPLRHL